MGWSKMRLYSDPGVYAQHRNRNHRPTGKQGAPTVRAQEITVLAIKNIELEEIMRESIIGDSVPGVQPLTVHKVARSQNLPEPRHLVISPSLQNVKLPF